MAGNDKSRAGRSEKIRQRLRPKAPAERPFDMWLQKQLHAMYDEIASEPLPGDLLSLIDRDAATAAEKKRAADKAPLDKKK